MQKKRALLKYDDAPPSETGLEVEVYLAEDVRWLLRELTYVSRETGQLLTVKTDVTDLVGPIIGVTRR